MFERLLSLINLEFTKSIIMERKPLLLLFCVISVLNLKFCETKHLIHNSKEVYVIRYFENQKITPVTIEIDLKKQTELVTSYDQNEGWKSVTFYDFSKRKVAYKDTDSNQCFVADLHGETLDEDRKRLRQINSGIVKGFFTPTLTIQEEIMNSTEIYERFGHLIHTFCNGSGLYFITRGSQLNQLSRKKRDTASSGKIGDRGQFTHHSYGHYGHQNNNYAHYGHETHITGAVDKDGNLQTQKISDHQTRSYGTQTYPPSGIGDTRQSQSTDSRSTSRNPHQQFPSSLQNGLAGNMGSSGQFSLQTAQESGYQLNLPFGLKAGNAYRGGIHSQGQYGVGGTKPQIQTSLYKYPGSQTTDTVEGGISGQQRRVTKVEQPIEGRISPGLIQTGYPDISRVGKDGYGVIDQGRGTDSLGQPGFLSSLRPGTGVFQPVSGMLRPDGSVIPGVIGSGKDDKIPGLQPRIMPPGDIIPGTLGTGSQLLPGQRITSSGEIITDSGIIAPSTRFRPGFYPIAPPSSISTFPSEIQVDQSRRLIPGTPGSSLINIPSSIATRPGGIYEDESKRLIPSFPDSYYTKKPGSISTRPGGIQVDESGKIIPGTPGIPGSYPVGIPGSIATRPDGSQVDQYGRVIPGIPGSYPIAKPGSIITRPDGTQVDQFGQIIQGTPASIITRQDGTQVDQFGRVIPGQVISGTPGSIITRPDGSRVDQFGRVTPGTPGYIIARPDGTQVDQFGRVIPNTPGSTITRSDGIKVDQFGRVIPGIPSSYPSGPQDSISRRPDGTIVDRLGRVIPGTQPDDSQILSDYIPGYPSSVPSGEYPGVTSRQALDVSKFVEGDRVTSASKTQPGDSFRFGGSDSASSQTQIQTGAESTAAEASSAGQYKGLGSQTQVQGGYKGNGSFSAQAQSGFTGGVTQSQVQGGKQGGLSGSSAIVEQVGSAQSQVQIGQPSGAASSTAQGKFSRGSTQVQAQSSRTGGSAGAESQSSGLSSSQVQVNIGGEDKQQQNGFQGTVSASVHGGLTSGQSQTQLQGGYNSGRTYVATAQGGFDSTQGFQGSVPGSGSLPLLSSLTGTSGDQQTVRIPNEERPGISPFSLPPQSIYQPSELRPPVTGFLQPVRYSRYPDSGLQPGQPGTIPPGHLSTDSGRPIYQPGLIQQPSTGVPSSTQILAPHLGLKQPHLMQPPSQISTGMPSLAQISSLHPELQPSDYQPGLLQPPSHVSGRMPSPMKVSPQHPGLQQSGYQPGSLQPPSTGIPSPMLILPPHSGLQQPSYQPGSLQPPSTGMPSSLLISPPRPGLQQPVYHPGSLQQPSTGMPSSMLISPPHSGVQQPGYQTGSLQPPSPGIPSSVLISPPRSGLQQPNYQPGFFQQPSHTSLEIPSSVQISPQRPGLQKPDYQPGLSQLPSYISTGVPSSIQISPPRPELQNPGYQPGLLQPPSHISTAIPSSMQISPPRPGLQQPGYQPGFIQPHLPDGISSFTGEQFVPGVQPPDILPFPSNVSRPTLPTRPPGVREPDLTDESNCCDALRSLRRRCCGTLDAKNGQTESSCCSKSNKFDNDFNLADDSDETTNGEPCKVVKAICYIVYKPVGKARICKPTKTNGC